MSWLSGPKRLQRKWLDSPWRIIKCAISISGRSGMEDFSIAERSEDSCPRRRKRPRSRAGDGDVGNLW